MVRGEHGGLYAIADGRRVATGPLRPAEVADDGRMILVTDGRVRVVGTDGTTLARFEFPSGLSATRPCPDLALADLVRRPGASCERGPSEAEPPPDADWAGAFAAWTQPEPVQPLAVADDHSAFVGRTATEYVVWLHDGSVRARLPLTVSSAPCLGGWGPSIECTIDVTPAGRYLLLSDLTGVRAFDGNTARALGRWRQDGAPFSMRVSQNGELLHVLPLDRDVEPVVLALPRLHLVRRLRPRRAWHAEWLGRWLVERERDGARVRFVPADSRDGTPTREVEGAIGPTHGGRIFIHAPGAATLALREADLAEELRVDAVLRCANDHETVLCQDQRSAVVATWVEGGPPTVESTLLPCPRDCDDVVGVAAFIVPGEIGDGRFTLARRADGALVEVVLAVHDGVVEAIAMDDASMLADHAERAMLRRPTLTADGMIPAPSRSETLAAWLAGP